MSAVYRLSIGPRIAGLIVAGAASLLMGCGLSGNPFTFFGGTPFQSGGTGGGIVTGPGQTGTSTGGSLTGSTGGPIDPCDESQSRKFVRISMRNLSPDIVHYFVLFVAFVNGDTYPDGAVCPDDIQLYTSNGYVLVREGTAREFGNYCIVGPALYNFHRSGQFRTAGGTGSSSLASAIGPAQGTAPTYDNFFTSAGASVPVPDLILFHNPGTGAGAALKISQNTVAPCSAEVVRLGDPDCVQDAFYYVDEDDRLVGTTALGFGSGRRVPNEIQGTGCECGLANDPWARLAPSNLAAADVAASSQFCDAFLRGGKIDFVFVRDDTDPPYPQLVWRVTDSTGSVAHDFDARADIR